MINQHYIKISNEKLKNIINEFNLKGYAYLGRIISSKLILKLQKRTDDLMMGRIKYKNMFFKLDDPEGNYFNIKHQDVKNEIFSGPSNRYKKIKDLEYDPLFLDLIKCKLFREISIKLIGRNVSSMRAMILNKSYIKSSILPFHQDVSKNWPMTGKPKFTIWLSLNGATKRNGCLKVIEGSHKHGIIGDGNNLLNPKLKKKFLKKKDVKYLELKAGEAIIFSNYTLHGSDQNFTKKNRLGFTVCMMDNKIRHKITKKKYPKIFGVGALTKYRVKKLKSIPTKVYEK